MAINSRTKGHSFERKIANRLREVFDPPELVKKMKVAAVNRKIKELQELRKQSVVRRGEQGHGALEPDIVISSRPDLWLELQHASKGAFNPKKKLEQAKRDIKNKDIFAYPFAICHMTNNRQIIVYCQLGALISIHENLSTRLNYPGDRLQNMDLYFDFKDFIKILERSV